jgi:regulator of nucleoside diphosphate kinase
VTTALYSTTRSAVDKLIEELDRAIVVDPMSIPPGVVTMDAKVECEDLNTGEVEACIITFPEHADVNEKRVSILAPIGTSLIGCREGNVVKWTTPDGIRHLKIRCVTPSPATATPEPLPSYAHL